MTRALDDGDPETCGNDKASYAGVWRHRRARETLCVECRAFQQALDNDRYRDNPEFAANKRLYSRARNRALNALARRHRDEFDALLLDELRKEHDGRD